MKVTGFTFIRNAIKFDYPIVEAIQSILPLCDEVVVAVGQSDDATKALIESIAPEKIRIIDTVWDDRLRAGGEVLAVETNKAFDAIAKDSTWAIYIQGDEVIHEKYHPEILSAMKQHRHNSAVEGLLFKYKHFYGSYDYIGNSRRWYRNEIRIVRFHPDVRSYKDAQGFRKNGNKLNVVPIQAEVYHYGWVKAPEFQQAKQEYFNKLWHNDDWVEKNIPKVQEFDYSQIDSLARFDGTHPLVMQPRINKINWKFDFDPTQRKPSLKIQFLHWIEQISGWRPGEYKNYKRIKT